MSCRNSKIERRDTFTSTIFTNAYFALWGYLISSGNSIAQNGYYCQDFLIISLLVITIVATGSNFMKKLQEKSFEYGFNLAYVFMLIWSLKELL